MSIIDAYAVSILAGLTIIVIEYLVKAIWPKIAKWWQEKRGPSLET